MMNIQIRINIRSNEHDDAFVASTIEKIMEFVRSLFPEMEPGRMDSPVIVTISQDRLGEPPS